MMMFSLMSHMRVGVRTVFALACLLGTLVAPAHAGVMPPDYGIQWCTVGGGANRPANAQELAGSPWMGQTFPFNPVAETFRIAKTEITNAQWVEFYRAYRSFVSPLPSYVSGGGIVLVGGVPTVRPGFQNVAATMGWEFAARYCNWLHNGKAMTREAFEQGVYDTSTFYTDSNGVSHHETTAAPGARFWIPTFAQWIKAAYWDPNKDNGAGGYWRFPNSSDTQPASGLPGAPGAQTNAGTGWLPGVLVPVGSYPDVRSPWGLLDVSGGVREFTSTPAGVPNYEGVFASLSSSIDYLPAIDQFGDFITVGFRDEFHFGLRLASSIPAPGATGLFTSIMASWALRRRRYQ